MPGCPEQSIISPIEAFYENVCVCVCVCVRRKTPATADERPTNHYQTADGPWTEDGPRSLKPANGCKSYIEYAVKIWKKSKN